MEQSLFQIYIMNDLVYCIYTYLLCYRWEFNMNFGFTMTLLGKGWVEVEAYLSDAVIFMGGVLFGRYDEAIHGWGTSPPLLPPDRLGLIKPESGTMVVEKWHLFRKDSINSLDYVVKRWTNVPVKTSVKSVQISIFLWQEVFYMRGKCHCVKVMASMPINSAQPNFGVNFFKY